MMKLPGSRPSNSHQDPLRATKKSEVITEEVPQVPAVVRVEVTLLPHGLASPISHYG